VAGLTRRLVTEIAQSVEALGDKFRPAMRWLKYIQTAYAAGPASAAASSTVQGTCHMDPIGSWLTTNYDVLLPLLPKWLIYVINADLNHYFEPSHYFEPFKFKFKFDRQPLFKTCRWRLQV
jgi:hypothetical protein